MTNRATTTQPRADLAPANRMTGPSTSQASQRPAALLAELDLHDHHSILFFGSRAQEELTRISDTMLERVKTKDLGAAGNALNDMVLALRGFDPARLDNESRPGWFGRLLGRGRDSARLLQRYGQVRDQIEAVLDDVKVDAAKTGMLKTASTVRIVAEAGAALEGRLVVDPVMVATSGDRLIDDEAVVALRESVFPLAVPVTTTTFSPPRIRRIASSL